MGKPTNETQTTASTVSSPEQAAALKQRQDILNAALKGLGGFWAQRSGVPMSALGGLQSPGSLASMPPPGPGAQGLQMPPPPQIPPPNQVGM